MRTFRKNGTRNTNSKTNNNGTSRETAHKEAERRWVRLRQQQVNVRNYTALETLKRRNSEKLIKQATMLLADYIRLTAQIAVLKEIALDYSGKTIDNIIQQFEAIKKEVEND